MLNYVEVMCELGEFDQLVVDWMVNKLCSCVNVVFMKVVEINDSFDFKCDLGNFVYLGDYVVNFLLWEICCECCIELFFEGFRFDDLWRWKKCYYVLKKKLGMYVKVLDFLVGIKVIVDGGGMEGYFEFYFVQNYIWFDYYYLNFIFCNERVLNFQFEQNLGWDDGIKQEMFD